MTDFFMSGRGVGSSSRAMIPLFLVGRGGVGWVGWVWRRCSKPVLQFSVGQAELLRCFNKLLTPFCLSVSHRTTDIFIKDILIFNFFYRFKIGLGNSKTWKKMIFVCKPIFSVEKYPQI